MFNKKNSLILLASIGLLSFTISCSNDDNAHASTTTPEIVPPGVPVLSEHIWLSTEAFDNNKNLFDLNTSPVSTYSGYTYYKPDGTFRVVDANNRTKLFGTWSLIENNTKKQLSIYKSDNTKIDSINNELNIYKVEANKIFDVVALNNSLFTYRINDDANPGKYYDLVNRVDNHAEPKIPAEDLAAVNWKTVKALDVSNGIENAVILDMNKYPASASSGISSFKNMNSNAYFPKNTDGNYVNGNFTVLNSENLEERVRYGDWYVSLDGKVLTIYLKTPQGEPNGIRKLNIIELTENKFVFEEDLNGTIVRFEQSPL
ncbi:DUF4822 domain-containing protein [Apibacter muscae]|uniref:DUF4822 domain-containing protein n=1 Tax=Apibacter muscae TaxID=2509004 RepID=UPI0011AE038A|nr:DUF4822 domain-containing protein [Apibacter muscae]TWP24093.1 DUF4822 domain-containing protein [Apibacter muscae]